MIADAIRAQLHREPFQRFSVRTTNGKRHTIHNRRLVVMMKSSIFIAAPKSDRFVQLPYVQITAVEGRLNGKGDDKPRRRRPR